MSDHNIPSNFQVPLMPYVVSEPPRAYIWAMFFSDQTAAMTTSRILMAANNVITANKEKIPEICAAAADQMLAEYDKRWSDDHAKK